jgi:EAL and modified HD-GYP domain-containing signal transduction protein
LDFRQLAEIIKQEVSLSFRLLRYINSAFFGLRNRISSIIQALALLGEEEIRKWVSLIALANMGEDKPEELVVQSIIRGKFCEFMAPHFGLARRKEDLFLMGIFSLIDAILDRPLTDIMEEIPIAQDIKNALLGERNRFRDVYEYVLASERGDWKKLSEMVSRIRMGEISPFQLYLEAVKWGHQCFEESS